MIVLKNLKYIPIIIGIVFGILGILRYIPTNIGTAILFICMGISQLSDFKNKFQNDKKLIIYKISMALMMIITGILWLL